MILNGLDCILAALYLIGLLALGIFAGHKQENSKQFLNVTGSLPLWVCIAACIAANCGSLDVIAMTALGAQYGMLACHFSWIGAVPALLVVTFLLLPAYARERYPTILDFIGHYYGTPTRTLVALCMAAMMLLLSGVCLCAVAQAMTTFLGWSFGLGVAVTASIVMAYTWMGGLRATIYTELLHFAVVLAVIIPLLFLVLRNFGGLTSLLARVPAAHAHAWKGLPLFAPHAAMDCTGLIFGLGLVLSFGFWSTDFVQMQRALAVRKPADVPFVPLSIAAAKTVFALIVVLPGVAAPLVLGSNLASRWNTTLPSLMLHYFKPSWVAVGFMGLAASLVSTFANNVAGFSAACVYGVYQTKIRQQASQSHYLWVGRIMNIAAVLLSIGAAYSALSYQSLMEYIQMILSIFNAPLFALVVLAALVPRAAVGGGVIGLLAGLGTAALHQVLVYASLLHYGSRMSANFYAAIFSFAVTIAVTVVSSRLRLRSVSVPIPGQALARLPITYTLPTVALALVVLGGCVLINVWLR